MIFTSFPTHPNRFVMEPIKGIDSFTSQSGWMDDVYGNFQEYCLQQFSIGGK
jgi:hypothetical protein